MCLKVLVMTHYCLPSTRSCTSTCFKNKNKNKSVSTQMHTHMLATEWLKRHRLPYWKKNFVLYLLIFIIFDGSDVDIIIIFVKIIVLFALISVFLLIYFCTMVASSNRLTNNAVQFALDRQRIEHFSYYMYFVWQSQNIIFVLRIQLKISVCKNTSH